MDLLEILTSVLLGLLVFVGRSAASAAAASKPSGPNIVLIIADDLGYGDVGCFGNDTIRTPNIDRIAQEGVKMTHHLAAAAICTPSRASFLTGRYAIRSGMESSNVFPVNIFVSSKSGLPPSEITIGEIAKEVGYSTGFIGKWHLGLNSKSRRDNFHSPLNQGFDYYFGIPLTNIQDFGADGLDVLHSKQPNFNTILAGILTGGVLFGCALLAVGLIGRRLFVFIVVLSFLPIPLSQWILYNFKHLNAIVMRNEDVVEQPIVLPGFTDRLVDEGVRFLQSRAKDRQPFLLVMSWLQVHTALHAISPFKGRSAHGPYGDEVEEMDWSVGEILKALDTNGLTNNTFVYFTSDNGGHVEETGIRGNREGGYNGIFKGGKGQGGMEGGIRVPTVARWPNVIPAGSEIGVPTSMMDIFPTVTGVIGGQVPTDRVVDGKDILALFRGESSSPPHDFLVHYCGDIIHGARYIPGDGEDVYKIHLATPNWEPGIEGCAFMCECHHKITWHDPPLMYNIGRDPSESQALDTSDPQYNVILQTILERIDQHRRELEPMESQFTLLKLMPRPWLQACCNFPYCKCRENVTVSDSHRLA